MNRSACVLSLLAVLALTSTADAQRAHPKANPREQQAISAPDGERIAWFGTLKSARAEAARTQRPLFLISARPACQGVPGFW